MILKLHCVCLEAMGNLILVGKLLQHESIIFDSMTDSHTIWDCHWLSWNPQQSRFCIMILYNYKVTLSTSKIQEKKSLANLSDLGSYWGTSSCQNMNPSNIFFTLCISWPKMETHMDFPSEVVNLHHSLVDEGTANLLYTSAQAYSSAIPRVPSTKRYKLFRLVENSPQISTMKPLHEASAASQKTSTWRCTVSVKMMAPQPVSPANH